MWRKFIIVIIVTAIGLSALFIYLPLQYHGPSDLEIIRTAEAALEKFDMPHEGEPKIIRIVKPEGDYEEYYLAKLDFFDKTKYYLANIILKFIFYYKQGYLPFAATVEYHDSSAHVVLNSSGSLYATSLRSKISPVIFKPTGDKSADLEAAIAKAYEVAHEKYGYDDLSIGQVIDTKESEIYIEMHKEWIDGNISHRVDITICIVYDRIESVSYYDIAVKLEPMNIRVTRQEAIEIASEIADTFSRDIGYVPSAESRIKAELMVYRPDLFDTTSNDSCKLHRVLFRNYDDIVNMRYVWAVSFETGVMCNIGRAIFIDAETGKYLGDSDCR